MYGARRPVESTNILVGITFFFPAFYYHILLFFFPFHKTLFGNLNDVILWGYELGGWGLQKYFFLLSLCMIARVYVCTCAILLESGRLGLSAFFVGFLFLSSVTLCVFLLGLSIARYL